MSISKDRKTDAIVRALCEALVSSPKDEGASLDDIYTCLDNSVKRKCSKMEIKFILSKGQFPGGKSRELGNGRFTYVEEGLTVDDSENSSPKDGFPGFATVEFGEVTPTKPVPDKLKKNLLLRTPSFLREKSERKRIQKVVFDPSDVEPKRKKLMTKKGEVEVVKREITLSPCKVCSESINSIGPKGGSGEVSTCEDCGHKAHTSCTKASDIRSARWRCEDCKLCSICRGKRSSRGETLIQCTVCDESYHAKCANIKKVTAPWLCTTCRRVFPGDSEPKEYSDSSPSITPPYSNSPEPKLKKHGTRRQSRELAKKEVKKEVNGDNIEEVEKIPDCTEWTPEQVHSYFMLYVPSQDAQVFLDQEIDGRILLLLNRSDVLTRFKLKLGPALKVYALVKRLQDRSSDIRLCWP